MPVQRITLRKLPAEARLYLFDFSRFPEVIAGETLSSPAVPASDPAGLTIGSAAVSAVVRDGIPAGQAVEVMISGGTADVTYEVEGRAVTSGGATLAVGGVIKVG
jgi:hypothetical protein